MKNLTKRLFTPHPDNFCCIGKSPAAPDFLRFSFNTPQAQTFGQWIDILYQQLSPLLKQNPSQFQSLFPLQGFTRLPKSSLITTVLPSQDATGRIYPFGMARWSPKASFALSYYQSLADFPLAQHKNAVDLHKSLQTLLQQPLHPTSSPPITLKDVLAPPKLCRDILTLHSWVKRLRSVPDCKQAIDIVLTSPLDLFFWIPLVEYWLPKLRWEHIYWQKNRALVVFGPLSVKDYATWMQQQPLDAILSLSQPTAVDPPFYQKLSELFQKELKMLEVLNFLLYK
jgi:type VI secretion system ImpM family protein